MPIAESQLERWSHQGATTSSATAYAAVQVAISRSNALQLRQIEVYLQGSYRNDTNIRGDSDVDVVVQSGATFFYDLGRLAEPVRSTVKASIEPEQYSWEWFRQDVLDALRSHFGAGRVEDRNKCITVVSAGGSGIAADVLPAFTYRLYLEGTSGPYHVEGIAFKTQREGRLVANFPKRHCDKGVEKNRQTAGEFKLTVRVFKNARSHLVDANMLQSGTAPSFFVECMVFNVANGAFSATTWQEQFVQVYNALDNADLNSFMCPSGVTPLFGATPEQWTVEDAEEFLRQLAQLWNAQ